jgi:hypothetical protein
MREPYSYVCHEGLTNRVELDQVLVHLAAMSVTPKPLRLPAVRTLPWLVGPLDDGLVLDDGGAGGVGLRPGGPVDPLRLAARGTTPLADRPAFHRCLEELEPGVLRHQFAVAGAPFRRWRSSCWRVAIAWSRSSVSCWIFCFAFSMTAVACPFWPDHSALTPFRRAFTFLSLVTASDSLRAD